ncbi:LOW QUALITY PROTEIN: uncharacterized protein LOC117892263 [Drosophila subobscura]|uniref:LOW QUALITY PROTEIN: uncharacterized protein LOC117892263 n=1 Tax=Drosophila subobscura TaxID=7241 RepID=UPI00155A0B3B|nr:LOW QUALITY PROTEIN: uncharacterized protein LOC117892263 [Drosophila subobscura]
MGTRRLVIQLLLLCSLALGSVSAITSACFSVSLEHQPIPMAPVNYVAASRLRRLAIEFFDCYKNITLADLSMEMNQDNRALPSAQDLECLADLTLLTQNLGSAKIWALRMIDSWGSLPSGVLYGNLRDLGNYDECLNVDHVVSTSHSVRGKYCFAKVSLASSTLSLLSIKTAVCFPASCSAAHMDTMLRRLFEKLLNVEISTDHQLVDENTCRSAEKKPYAGLTIFTIVVLSVLCALMVLSTFYDYLFIEDQKQFSPLVKAFSARANSRVLFRIVDTKSNPNIIDCGWYTDFFFFSFSHTSDAMPRIYFSTHTRASPYLVGILFGYFLHANRGVAVKLNRTVVFLGWLISLALLFTCIFSLYGYHNNNKALPIVNDAFNLTLTRIAWPLGLCWVVFACMHGYGGLANSFLASPLWQPLSKLSYSAYIFHMFIESLNGGITRTNTFFSDYQVMLRFWGDFGFTLLLAFFVYILIEAPFGNLESLLLSTHRTKKNLDLDAQQKTVEAIEDQRLIPHLLLL